MNFNRKSDNSNGKVAEGSQAFPDIAPIFDEEQDADNYAAAADYQNGGGEEYPSGAFPALDIAYPGQNRRNAGGNLPPQAAYENAQTHENDSPAQAYPDSPAAYERDYDSQNPYSQNYRQADFPIAEDAQPLQYDNRGSYGQNYAPQALPPEVYAQRGGQETAGAQGQGDDVYAQGGYGQDSYPPQGGFYPSEPNLYHEARRQPPYPMPRQADNAASAGIRADDRADAAGYAPAHEPFADENFPIGFGDAPMVQPARFDPSDYDYSYDDRAGVDAGAPNAESFRESPAAYRQSQGQRGPYAETRNPAYGEQRSFSPPPIDRRPQAAGRGRGGDAFAFALDSEARSDSAMPPHNAAAAYPAYADSAVNERIRPEYAPQAERGLGAEHFERPIAPEDFVNASYNQHEAEFDRQNPSANMSYLGADRDELPFGDYQPESAAVSRDFMRLDRDAEEISRAAGAGGLPPQGENWAEQSGGQENSFADWDNFGALPEDFPPAAPQSAADLVQNAPADFTNPEPNRETETPPINEAAEAEQDFLPDADEGTYDWAAPAAADGTAAAPKQEQPRRRAKGKSGRKLFLTLLALCVLAAAAAGLYWKFGKYAGLYSGEPPIIRKAEGDYKTKAENQAKNAAAGQEQSVSEGVSGGSAQTEQKALIDKTEAPVETQKMEERLPFSDEKQGNFDQSSVDSLIKTTIARAAPVHIIPSVKVDADRNIIAASGNIAERILIPGGSGNLLVNAANGAKAADKASEKAKKTNDKTVAAAAPPPQANRAAQAAPPFKAAAAASPPQANRAAQASPPLKAAAAAPPRPPKADVRQRKTQTAASAAGFFMQISSQPTKEAAEQSLRTAKQHMSPEMAAKLVIVPASIPDKGTYYRVRLAAESREAAAALCETYKQAGGSCFVAH